MPASQLHQLTGTGWPAPLPEKGIPHSGFSKRAANAVSRLAPSPPTTAALTFAREEIQAMMGAHDPFAAGLPGEHQWERN